MNQPIDNERLSMFVDGELDNNQSTELLLEVLDDESSCGELKKLLNLRHAFSTWRRQGDELSGTEPMTPPPTPSLDNANHRSLLGRDWGRILVAALLGGVLVLGGMLATQQHNNPVVIVNQKTKLEDQEKDLKNPPKYPMKMQQHPVGKFEQQQVAQVFAFQESVAGPLSWYGADDQNIQLQSAPRGNVQGAPLAIRLHLKGEKFDENYLIVCRDHIRVHVTLPQFLPNNKTLEIQVQPAWNEGQITLKYSLVVVPDSRLDGPKAVLIGKQQVSLDGVRLGQFVLEGQLFSVNANAWRIDDEPTL